MTSLKLGTQAPDFELPRDGGDLVKLSAYRGKNVILYFYPRDDTPGCTLEAQEFTASVDAFLDANSVVLGISKDTVEKHDDFQSKYDLGIPLLSDANGNVCEEYDVWHEKTMNGNTFMGILRTTFLIDTNGNIARIWPNVVVEGHSDEVLQAAKGLS